MTAGISADDSADVTAGISADDSADVTADASALDELLAQPLDRSAGVAEQLRTRIVEAVRGGTLVAGTRLPPVRELAARTGLAAGTAARVVKELEAEGVVETKGRAGTFVRAANASEEAAAKAAREFADRMRTLAISEDAAVALVKAAFAGR